MRVVWKTSLLVVISCAMLAGNEQVLVGAYGRTVSQLSKESTPQARVVDDSDIGEEEPESVDPKERNARKAKNARYSIGGRDLATHAPEVEHFIEQVWPAVDFIPAADSAVVATGRVVKVQPYLSSDRSRIYTEITVAVDDLLKRDRSDVLSAAHNVVMDRLGGALKLKTGRIVRDDVQIDWLGKPLPGKRYVFFARRVNDGSDISLIKSYELVNGKVFTNGSRPSRLISTLLGVPEAWEDEAAFLKAVRQVTASTGTGGRKR